MFLINSKNIINYCCLVPKKHILNIKNIEARIYDMTEYILLLEREKIRVIKVSENGEKLFGWRCGSVGKMSAYCA